LASGVDLNSEMGRCQLNSVWSIFLPLSLERGQAYRRAEDFSAPNRRATDGRRMPPLLKLAMPPRELLVCNCLQSAAVLEQTLAGGDPRAVRSMSMRARGATGTCRWPG
jgi:hypothetical protein